MSWIPHNENPDKINVGDCVIRAISKALGQEWDKTYLDICLEGLIICDMPSANHVWGAYLRRKGYKRYIIPDDCPDCYTVKNFCRDHPNGTYILAISGHVVCCIDGNYYDTWDSGSKIPVYYWKKEI